METWFPFCFFVFTKFEKPTHYNRNAIASSLTNNANAGRKN